MSLALLVLTSLTAHSALSEDLSLALKKCGAIDNDIARLVCFDELVESHQKKIKQYASDTVSKSVVQQVAPSTQPTVEDKVAKFGAQHLKKTPEEDQQDNEVTFTVAKLTKDPYKRWYITFENGQRWKQTDESKLRIKVGDSVILTKGFMSAVYLKKNTEDAKRRIRVKRLK